MIMDMGLILGVLGAVLGWLGFMEKRVRDIMSDVDKKIETNNKINEVIQIGLKEDIARLEAKIDMLLNFSLNRNRTDGK